MCTKTEHEFWEKANKIQNQVNGIRDSLSVIEGNLCDFADSIYEPNKEVKP